MSGRYVLAPEAAHDLVQIWRYVGKQSSAEVADRVESVIRGQDHFSYEKPWRWTLA
jgi:plasmid stabilization system protein ParE